MVGKMSITEWDEELFYTNIVSSLNVHCFELNHTQVSKNIYVTTLVKLERAENFNPYKINPSN